MMLVALCLLSFAVSLLTFFSGFGLGTLLMPAFALFMPLDQAVAGTAVVHFLNNVLKLALVGRNANRETVIKFGLPALAAALGGAAVLVTLSSAEPLLSYQIGPKTMTVSWLKIIMALLMGGFAFLELSPLTEKLSFDKKYLPVGGVISGFLGGLSGHQGALRAAFLLRLNLSKESFIATGIAIAFLVDITRLSVYFVHFKNVQSPSSESIFIAATLSALVGTLISRRLLTKITLRSVQRIVSAMLMLITVLLGLGLI